MFHLNWLRTGETMKQWNAMDMRQYTAKRMQPHTRSRALHGINSQGNLCLLHSAWLRCFSHFLVALTMTCNTYPNTVADKVHPLMERVFLNGGHLLQQRCYRLQKRFEEHNTEFKVLSWHSNSTDPNPSKYLWDVRYKPCLDTAHLTMCRTERICCQTLQHTFRDRAESMLWWVSFFFLFFFSKGWPTQCLVIIMAGQCINAYQDLYEYKSDI